MNFDNKQLIKDRIALRNIKNNINKLVGTSIIKIYKKSDIGELFSNQIKEIHKISTPIFMSKKRGYKSYEYVEFLYRSLNLPTTNYNWIIPSFESNSWWVELKVDNLNNFMNFYYQNNIWIDLTVIDIKNKLLFSIEDGETDFEYYMTWL